MVQSLPFPGLVFLKQVRRTGPAKSSRAPVFRCHRCLVVFGGGSASWWTLPLPDQFVHLLGENKRKGWFVHHQPPSSLAREDHPGQDQEQLPPSNLTKAIAGCRPPDTGCHLVKMGRMTSQYMLHGAATRRPRACRMKHRDVPPSTAVSGALFRNRARPLRTVDQTFLQCVRSDGRVSPKTAARRLMTVLELHPSPFVVIFSTPHDDFICDDLRGPSGSANHLQPTFRLKTTQRFADDDVAMTTC